MSNNYLKLAKEYIKESVGENYTIVEDSIFDLDDFFVFTYQTKKYIETKQFQDMAVGQGYYFFYKKDKRIFVFGSSYSYEVALNKIRRMISNEIEIRQFLPQFNILEEYNLNILESRKKQLLVDALIKLKVTYVIPEVIGTTIYRVPKFYKKNLLFERLRNLPIIFHGIENNKLPQLIIELYKGDFCKFKLIPKSENNLAKYVDKAAEIDLTPIW